FQRLRDSAELTDQRAIPRTRVVARAETLAAKRSAGYEDQEGLLKAKEKLMKKEAAALKTNSTELPNAGSTSANANSGSTAGGQAQEESYLEDRFTLVALSHLIKEAAD
ncbi:MAG: hypothetical protein ACOY58_04740, partial [Candidatus Micrarchaeota archaeon]